MARMGLPAILHGGVEWHPTTVDPDKLGLQDLARFNEARIAVLLHVPPFLVGLPSGGDSLTYSTTENLFDYHWRAGLRPMARMVMPALSDWLLPPSARLEVNADSYIQPGPYARAQTWEILVRMGVLTVEQVQAIERYTEAVSAAPALDTGMMTL
jgi:hypothetical protein